MAKDNILKGGEFLIKETKAADVFIPEDFSEEQVMIAQTCNDFLESFVYPNLDRIDNQEEGLMKHLLQKSGELGLLAISIPSEYEGFDQSFVTSMIASEYMGAGYSFSVAYSAHTGIGSLPITYYGNDGYWWVYQIFCTLQRFCRLGNRAVFKFIFGKYTCFGKACFFWFCDIRRRRRNGWNNCFENHCEVV
jgi:hypothetical protein